MNTLNERAWSLSDALAADAAGYRVAASDVAGCRVIDCGSSAPGGVRAGLQLARVCLAGLAEVTLSPAPVGGVPFPEIVVHADNPAVACLAAQYAGWQVKAGKYFAMGSGPMRAKYGREKVFDHLAGREDAPVAVGVLETRKVPTAEVVAALSEKLGMSADRLTLLFAPTASPAGTVQVTARALETALHKLHELQFDVSRVAFGCGSAPLLPPAAGDLAALGRTNDAVLYGGRVTLWVDAGDDELNEVGPRVPSCASPDHGEPFGRLFQRAGGDFYKIDPLLFSPAEVTMCSLRSGRAFAFGKTAPEVLRRSLAE